MSKDTLGAAKAFYGKGYEYGGPSDNNEKSRYGEDTDENGKKSVDCSILV